MSVGRGITRPSRLLRPSLRGTTVAFILSRDSNIIDRLIQDWMVLMKTSILNRLVALPAIAVFLAYGCAGTPQFDEIAPAALNSEVDPDPNLEQEEAPQPIAGTTPIRMPSDPITPVCQESSFEGRIVPSATRGANVVFLIDDSGSMDREISKVVEQIQKFISGINSASGNNYRIVLIFNTTVDAPRKLSPGANPFQTQLANPNVKYIEQRTWSKWADIAFYRAFAPASFMQAMPSPIPEDKPFSGASMTADSCSGPGKYFRPRDYQSNFFNTPGCVSAVSSAIAVESFLLPNIAVNIIALSDDDLNVAFNRTQFSATDPEKNAYPEISYLMMKQVLAPLGLATPMVYHSIVGTATGPDIPKVGTAHMALSKKTNGGIHSITLSSYQPIFADLQEKIIFAEKSVELQCAVRADKAPQVMFNGQEVETQNYSVTVGDKVVRFKPEAFDNYDPSAAIDVRVDY